MQLVLDTRGLSVSVRNRCFLLETERETRMIHPSRVSSILITMPCRISSPALILASRSEIPVIFCDGAGHPEARIWSPRFTGLSTLRRKQYVYTSNSVSMLWMLRIILNKTSGQLSNLLFLADRKPSLEPAVKRAVEDIRRRTGTETGGDKFKGDLNRAGLLWIESYIAAKYWPLAGRAFDEPFCFVSRNKRGATDPFNICLNYLYGMLRNHTETAVLSMGLDPALGILHRDGYRMPSLVFDLMEPFRPMVDRLLFTALLKRDLSASVTEETAGSIQLSREGRKKLIQMFNQGIDSRVKYQGKVTSIRNHVLSEAKALANEIRKHEG